MCSCNPPFILVGNTCQCNALDYSSFANGPYCLPNCYVPFCLICSNLTCSLCIQGYSLNVLGTNCILNNCTTNCTSCQQGYSLSGGVCISNLCSITHCISCDSASTCGNCSANYIYNSTSASCDPVCLSNIANCFICSSAVRCTLCQYGYALNGNFDNNTCLRLCSIANCYSCDSASTCNSCSQNYQLNSDQTACLTQCNTSNCNICRNSTSCSSCVSGYTLINNLCIKSCADGLTIGAGSTPSCQACSTINQLCVNCQFANSSLICTACSPTAFLSTAASCLLCSSLISNCLSCTSLSNCISCSYPYSIVNGSCHNVSCDIVNCLLCSPTNSSVCLNCANGFIFNSSTLLCNPPSCSVGFILSGGACKCSVYTMQILNTCISCPVNCYGCSSIGCDSCSSGYYLAFN